MKVLLTTKMAGFQMFGGLEIQMLRTKDALVKRGVDAKLFDLSADRIEDFDLIHNFGSDAIDMLPLAYLARRRGVPLVVSPVYWPFHELRLRGAPSTREWIRGLFMSEAQQLGKIFRIDVLNPTGALCRRASMCLPNSESEARILRGEFGISADKIRVVPNAADERFRKADPRLFRQRFGVENFVLFVGRIEPRKNVLRLVRACKRNAMQLAVIGRPDFESSYVRKCREEGGKFTHFVGEIHHEDPMLASAMAAADIFALPSWAETPGIAALEAALTGTRVVITNRGSTHDYFGSLVEYCDPRKVSSIAAALRHSLSAEKDARLKDHVSQNYTWDRVAEATRAAYEAVVDRKRSGSRP